MLTCTDSHVLAQQMSGTGVAASSPLPCARASTAPRPVTTRTSKQKLVGHLPQASCWQIPDLPHQNALEFTSAASLSLSLPPSLSLSLSEALGLTACLRSLCCLICALHRLLRQHALLKSTDWPARRSVRYHLLTAYLRPCASHTEHATHPELCRNACRALCEAPPADGVPALPACDRRLPIHAQGSPGGTSGRAEPARAESQRQGASCFCTMTACTAGSALAGTKCWPVHLCNHFARYANTCRSAEPCCL